MMILLTAANGQTRVDSVSTLPNTEITLDIVYPLIEGAVFNDVVAFEGTTTWAETNGFSMIYVDRSAEIVPPFDGWLGNINDSEEQVNQHQFVFAAAGVTDVRVDQDVAVARATFLAPDGLFEPVTLTILTELKINESNTRYFHAWKITVDPNFGTDIEQSKEINLGITADLYPNPNPHTLEIKLDSPSYTTVEVVDILGRKRQSLMNDSFLPDGTLVKLSLNELESGIYFLVTSTNNGRHVKTFTVLK